MYPVYAMLGLMFLTWGIAVWASFEEPSERRRVEAVSRKLKEAA